MHPKNRFGQIFVALVAFQRSGDPTEVLPPEAEGACGWMGVIADHEDEVIELFQRSLTEVGLRLLEVEQITPIFDADEAEEFDDRLAANMRRWEPNERTVWGTLHVYLADGEA